MYCTDYQPPHSSTDTITAIVYHAVSDDEIRVELNQLIKCEIITQLKQNKGDRESMQAYYGFKQKQYRM